jgi:hypothetical protein
MPEPHDRADEPLSDLPEPAVTNDEAQTVKGGATETRQGTGATTPSAPVPRYVPKAIDPCW